MLRLESSKAQERKDLLKLSKPLSCLVAIGKLSLRTLRWVPYAKVSVIFLDLLPHLVLAKLVTSMRSIRVKIMIMVWYEKHIIHPLTCFY